MTTASKLGAAMGAAALTLVSAGSALAEEAQAGMALPQQAAGATGATDHDAVVGRLAVGYLGRATVPIATGSATGTAAPGFGAVPAPIVGIRYWLDPMLGIDAGIGFSTSSGSTEVSVGATSTTTDQPATTAFYLHGGVPLSLAAAKHYSFQVVPELNVGFASQTVDGAGSGAPPGSASFGGFTLDIGARAGAEIHFGFMGLPDLSLQAGVGVLFRTQSVSITDDGPVGAEFKASQTLLTTTVGNTPFDIFTSNIAALYYF